MPLEQLPLIAPGEIDAGRLKAFRLAASEHILEAFKNGIQISKLTRAQSRVVDQLLYHLWTTLISSKLPGWSLVAVGGYGRAELHPGSDIDLMILIDKEDDKKNQELISQFISLVWDTGLELGHSVRTLKECVVQAKADITVATNLMEARLVAGSPLLFHEMRHRTNSSQIWSGKTFYEAKIAEQKQRHKRFLSSSYSLQPNLKESPGGLRDIQVIGWVTKRHFQVDSLSALVALGFITPAELKSMLSCLHFLWKVRFALHTIAGRREDRLLFDLQGPVAEFLGFGPATEKSAVEQLMRRYYRTVLRIRELNDVLLQLFNEAILTDGTEMQSKEIDEYFQITAGFIEAKNKDVFQNNPENILKIFVHLADNSELKGIRAKTIRLLQNSLNLINDDFRNRTENQQNFLSILSQHQSLTTAFVYLKRYGVLKRYLPAYAKIVGLMQFDLFHVYTVDEHTLFLMRNLARFSMPEHADEFPLCSKIVSEQKRPEILYITGLFHDIAKGRGGDHSELGAEIARDFSLQHGLRMEDAELISWLVKNHLLLSMVSQKKDIYNPEVIAQFAAQVQDYRRLSLLYVLTVADIRATNPTLWNSWRDALTKELYKKTQLWLASPEKRLLNHSEFSKLNQQEAKTILQGRNINPEVLEDLQSKTDASYFQKYSASQVAWHCQLLDELSHIRLNEAQDKPSPSNLLVKVRRHPNDGASEVFIYTNDRKGLFSDICQLLFEQQLNIMKATIHTNKDGFCMNTFVVLELDGKPISSSRRNQLIATTLAAKLEGNIRPASNFKKAKHHLHFDIKTQIKFSQNGNTLFTELELTTLDRPGLLAHIGRIFNRLNIRLHGAKIATFGEKVEDIFLVTLPKTLEADDKNALEQIKINIIKQLDNLDQKP